MRNNSFSECQMLLFYSMSQPSLWNFLKKKTFVKFKQLFLSVQWVKFDGTLLNIKENSYYVLKLDFPNNSAVKSSFVLEEQSDIHFSWNSFPHPCLCFSDRIRSCLWLTEVKCLLSNDTHHVVVSFYKYWKYRALYTGCVTISLFWWVDYRHSSEIT